MGFNIRYKKNSCLRTYFVVYSTKTFKNMNKNLAEALPCP